MCIVTRHDGSSGFNLNVIHCVEPHHIARVAVPVSCSRPLVISTVPRTSAHGTRVAWTPALPRAAACLGSASPSPPRFLAFSRTSKPVARRPAMRLILPAEDDARLPLRACATKKQPSPPSHRRLLIWLAVCLVLLPLCILYVVAPAVMQYIVWPRQPYAREVVAVLDLFGLMPMSSAAVESAGIERRSVNKTEMVAALRRCRTVGCDLPLRLPPPQTTSNSLNAIVRWRARHDHAAFLPAMVDKVLYRELAGALGETTPPLLFSSSGACDALPAVSSLPAEGYVVKARHAAACTLVVRHGVVVTHSTCNGGHEWLRVLAAKQPLLRGAVADRFKGRDATDALLREVCLSFSSQLYLFSLSECARPAFALLRRSFTESRSVTGDALLHAPPLRTPGQLADAPVPARASSGRDPAGGATRSSRRESSSSPSSTARAGHRTRPRTSNASPSMARRTRSCT